VTLWNLKNGSMVRETKEQGDTFHLSWSSDGTMLSSCFSKGLLHIMLADDIAV
jgi:WD40 repeat protein